MTLALVLKAELVVLAFDSRETMMRWQVRLSSQFEEGQHFPAHLLQAHKSKSFPVNSAVRIHLQNRRFSMTHGVPPKLVHSWNMADLRRYGAVENGRFCFEGGSRCGKGEGLHLLRVDSPHDLQTVFDLASKGKLEGKRKSVYKCSMTSSPSIPSGLNSQDRHASQSLSGSDGSRAQLIQEDASTVNTRSRSRSRSINWSSAEGRSCETVSVALSEMEVNAPKSPDHLVNRKALLERMGMSVDSGSSSKQDFNYPQWTMNNASTSIKKQQQQQQQQHQPLDRISLSSHDSSNYDSPRSVMMPRPPSANHHHHHHHHQQQQQQQGENVPLPLTPKVNRRAKNNENNLRRAVMETPCNCECSQRQLQQQQQQQQQTALAYQNYDIPRSLNKDAQKYNFGNYDFPQNCSLPVYRKQCGCIMKLAPAQHQKQQQQQQQSQDNFVWTCVSNSNDAKNFAPTKVKLTGTGKMPVQDFSRGKNQLNLTPPKAQETSSTSPVYAVVNKAAKKGAAANGDDQQQPNYCNVNPKTGEVDIGPNYVNLEPVMMKKSVTQQSKVQSSPSPPPPPPTPPPPNPLSPDYDDSFMPLPPEANYMPMFPANYDADKRKYVFTDISELPLIPFQPFNEEQCRLSMNCDSISRRFREVHRGLGKEDNSPAANDDDKCKKLKSKSIDNLEAGHNSSNNNNNNLHPNGCYVTMPRSASSSGGSGDKSGGGGDVNMRRSASVPCKRTGRRDRGSTGSSDSGFSTGSPPPPVPPPRKESISPESQSAAHCDVGTHL